MVKAIRKVDHLLLPLSDPRGAWLYLAEALRLPINASTGPAIDPWSQAGRAVIERVKGGRYTGEIGLGNVNLEPLPKGDWQVLRDGRAHIQAIALEPELDVPALLTELAERGIAHLPPIDLGPGEFDGTTWHHTTVNLPELLDGSSSFVFVCRCHQPAEFMDPQLRQAALDAAAGGVLGVIGAAEVVIGARDVGQATDRWRRLLEPAPELTAGCWHLGAGPDQRIVEADVDGVVELVVNVRSLDAARAAAADLGMSVEARGTDLAVRIDALDGLAVTLRSRGALAPALRGHRAQRADPPGARTTSPS